MSRSPYEIQFRLGAIINPSLRTAFASAQKSLSGLNNHSELVSNSFKAVGTGAIAAVTGLGTLSGIVAKVGLGYNMMTENSQVAWTTLLGTQQKAAAMLGNIANFAKSTQFGTEQVDAMAKYMNNAGLQGKALFAELTKVADVSGAFNIPAESALELTRQMSQVRQAGVAYTEDLNILQDRGVPIYKAIAAQVGTNVGAVKKMASEGTITSDIYLKAFDRIAKGVAGSSQKQSQTMTGMLSTLKDNATMISGLLTQELFNKLKGTLTKVMPVIDKFSSTLKNEGLKSALKTIFSSEVLNNATKIFNNIKNIGQMALNVANFVKNNWNGVSSTILAVAAATVTLKAGFTALSIIDIVTKSVKAYQLANEGATIAQALLNTTMLANPATWVVIGIAALVAAAILLWRNWDTVKAKTVELWNTIKNNPIAWIAAGPIMLLITAGVKLYQNWDKVKSIMSLVWSSMKQGAATAVNGVIGSINSLIGAINKIPGVNIPIIAKVNWGQAKLPPASKAAKHISVKQALPYSKTVVPRSNKYVPVNNMLKGYATGGIVPSSQWALVGENGPELASFKAGTRILPHEKSKGMLANLLSFGKSDQTNSNQSVKNQTSNDGFVFAPVINVPERADKSEIEAFILSMMGDQYEVFKKMMKQYNRDKKELAFD